MSGARLDGAMPRDNAPRGAAFVRECAEDCDVPGFGRAAVSSVPLRQGDRRGTSLRSESAIGFLGVPARRFGRQVCGLVAAPPLTEAAAYSRSPRLAGHPDREQ